MAAPAWTAPIALAPPNVAQRQTNRGNQSQSFLKIALGRIELYDGATDLLTVNVYIQAHKAYYTQQITFNAFGFTFFDYAETIPMSLTPELHAWHNGKVAELTAMAGYPGPALPAGFTAKDVSDRCSEWYWEQFATRFSPKNQTDSIQAQLRVIALGNSLEGFVTDFYRLINLNAVAIRLNGAANEKSISDREKLDWFKDGIIRNPMQGRYLASQTKLSKPYAPPTTRVTSPTPTWLLVLARLPNLALVASNLMEAEVEDEEDEEAVVVVSAAMESHTAFIRLSRLLPADAISCPQTPVVPRTPTAPRAPRTPSTRGSFPGTPSRRGNPFTPQTPTRRSTFTPANYPTPSRTPAAASAICYRCGRQGHYARNCNAKTDVEGNVMYSTSLFYYDAPTDPFEDVEFHEEDPTYDISDSSINAYQRAEEENTGEDEEGGPTHDDGPVFADFHDGCA
ncbi:hypothetical protein HKX48_002566 [Thoreauomyces humboldtii]|nr:hypothetical protein HKX48_002566 [Thoreauomyces humboldtii]